MKHVVLEKLNPCITSTLLLTAKNITHGNNSVGLSKIDILKSKSTITDIFCIYSVSEKYIYIYIYIYLTERCHRLSLLKICNITTRNAPCHGICIEENIF